MCALAETITASHGRSAARSDSTLAPVPLNTKNTDASGARRARGQAPLDLVRVRVVPVAEGVAALTRGDRLEHARVHAWPSCQTRSRACAATAVTRRQRALQRGVEDRQRELVGQHRVTVRPRILDLVEVARARRPTCEPVAGGT